jgi:hypothetical protein
VSTALAIAATTKVLTQILDNRIQAANLSGILETAVTTAVPPDRVVVGDGELPHLNVFLYEVTYNQGWRQAGLPSMDTRGNTIGRPPLAIDLHYLVSAYGEIDFQGEILLGLGMQALHETPVPARDQIRAVFEPPPPPDTLPHRILIELATAGLADQVELVKITPEPLNNEELSKLWTAFQAKYRSSAGYCVSLVLIQTEGSFRSALPVLSRNVYALAVQQPVIELVEEQMLPFSAGAAIHLRGQNLLSPDAVVRFGSGQEQVPDKLLSTGGRLTVPLPVLNAGLNSVQIVRKLVMGTPPPRPLVESNVAAFVLQPVIKKSGGPPVDDITFNPATLTTPPSITVKVDPPIQSTQKVTLLLDQFQPPLNSVPLGYQFDSPPLSGPPTDTVTVPVPGAQIGQYFLRVRVDGAQSPFEFDANNAFSGPLVTVT